RISTDALTSLTRTALTWMRTRASMCTTSKSHRAPGPGRDSRDLHRDAQPMYEPGTVFSAWWSGTGLAQPTLVLNREAPAESARVGRRHQQDEGPDDAGRP